MSGRRTRALAACLWVFGFAAGAAAQDVTPPVASGPLSIAVAPFDSGADSPSEPVSVAADVATLLAKRLAEHPPTSVIEPSALNLAGGGALEAQQVRDLAQQAGVDHVVFGVMTPVEGGVAVAVEVRSGHSGVATSFYQAPLIALDDPQPGVDALAESILAGLGYQPPAPPPAAVEVAVEKSSGRKLIRKGEAISINSEELEVTQDDEGRHLVFRRDVRVEQGDVQLSADQLDAYYKKGESQPDRLVARGEVRLKQGDRRARCDVATFYNIERRVVCSGRAEVRQDCDVVRGLEIEFDLRGERIRVNGAASVVIHGDENGDCTGELL